MIHYEHQNPFEAFYAINTLCIIMFAITMKCKYNQQQKVFNNIRVLPSRAKFRSQIEKWAAAALEEITTETS